MLDVVLVYEVVDALDVDVVDEADEHTYQHTYLSECIRPYHLGLASKESTRRNTLQNASARKGK